MLYLAMAFNGRFVLNMIQLASVQGADINELISLTDKTREELVAEDTIVEDDQYNRLVELIVEVTGNSNFGVHAGESLNLSAAGLILQLVQNSKTIKQAYELCCEYANLGCSVLPMTLVEKGEHYKVVFEPNQKWRNNSEIAFRQTALGVMVFKIKEFHSLTYLHQVPIRVNIPWNKESDDFRLDSVFGCKVYFSQPELAIHFRKEHINANIITSNYTLLQTLVEHADEISKRKFDSLGFGASVSQTIINLIKPDFPSLAQVADYLNISSRTLQRKLKEEGLSYKKIIEELKKDFALGYIKKKHLSVGEIAYLLGYTELSAFTRSFKRWTGMSPVQYREQI